MPRPVVALLTLLALLAPSAGATWSIVLTDMATGEVAVGTATCLPGIDIQDAVPVIVVGVGAAAAQSQVDPTAKNKKVIVAELLAGTDPFDIVQILKAGDPLLKCTRQYGIVDLQGRARGFSGGCASEWKGHLTGQVGTITYSIQGNVLTGEAVLLAAEQAVIGTTGRLSDRLMRGMQAAVALGGDGRCSCDLPGADDCGAPPVGGEDAKTAHVASMQLARVGDVDGTCLGSTGCASGDYWMDLNVSGLADDPDPVSELAAMYAGFLARKRGRPDGLHSTLGAVVEPGAAGVPQAVERLLRVRDLDGEPVTHGGASIEVSHAPGSAGLFGRHEIEDHGDGTYTLRLWSQGGAGTDLLDVTLSAGHHRATLFPAPAVVWP